MENEKVVLFHPYVSQRGIDGVVDTLNTRWIGQGPKVDLFEQKFSARFGDGRPAIAVGSGTDAVHLSYLLAGVQPGDEVITSVFTCTATNIPLLYIGAKPVFADIQPDTLNIDPNHVRDLITPQTRAIMCVHYGGLPCDMKELTAIAAEHKIPLIEDAASAMGATYRGIPVGGLSDFTAFSFQGVKHFTTGDGGMVTLKNASLVDKGKRLRWFGIDRNAKLNGNWENDVREIGYKYQMTDIAAALGLAGLEEFEEILKLRRQLFATYEKGLKDIPGVQFIGGGAKDREHSAWAVTISVERGRVDLERKLREKNIESSQVHYRNDRYTTFGGRRKNLPNMDAMEERYLVLPLHHKVKVEDVTRICDTIRTGW